MKKILNSRAGIIFSGTVLIVIYKLLSNYKDIKVFISGVVSAVFPCLLGFVFALFLYIPVKKTEDLIRKKTGGFLKRHAREISVISMYILIIGLFVLGLFYVVPVLYKSLEDLVANIPSYTRKAEDFLTNTVHLKNINLSETVGSGILGYLSFNRMEEYLGIINSITSSLTSILVALAISVYLLIEREDIKRYFKKISQAFGGNRYKNATKYIKNTIELFCSYFAGQGIDALLVGVITTVGLALLGVSYPVLIGVIIAVGNFIPVFGCIVSTLISAILIFVTRGFLEFITMLLFLITVHNLDAYFIQPKIAGKTTGIKPVAALIAVVVFGNFFGVAGMFLGVPVTAAAKMIIDDVIN